MSGPLRPAVHASFFSLCFLCLAAAGSRAPVDAQQTDPAPRPPARTTLVGEVVAVDAAAGRLSLRTDDGRTVEVALDAQTQYLRARPGATTLEGAQPTTLAEIAAGDRVLARGAAPDGGGTPQARQVVVMTRGDIADKQERERAEWRRRGVAGVITALDAGRQEVTVELRGLAATQTLVLDTARKPAAFRRYAPDSVKFDDARPSGFAELQVGDQLRALGERSADGARFVAEQVVSGAFRTVVGSVDAVDAGKREVRITDLQARGKLTIAVGAETLLRRLPPEMAARLLQRAGAGGAEAEAAAGGRRWGPRSEGGGAGRGPQNLGDLLERLPPITLADLKPGDSIAVSSTRGSDATRLTAIALVSGIEALAPPEAGSRRREGGLELGLPAGAMDMGMGLP